MITHIVLLSLAGPANDALVDIMDELAALQTRLLGMSDFAHGANLDAEGLSPHCDYGFTVCFKDRDALSAYAADAEHKAIGERLMALCKGGTNGLTVVDLDV